MATCPKCNSEIKDDFGLVECSGCGAQVLLQDDISQVLMDEVIGTEGIAADGADANANADFADGFAVDAADTPSPALGAEWEVAEVESRASSPDLSDIAEFGNSVQSQGREGLLRYNILISGIDTSELRKQIQDALADEKFLWDAESLLSELKNGQLRLKDVTAVKSSLLLQKLRPLDVKISWEQYAIHQG